MRGCRKHPLFFCSDVSYGSALRRCSLQIQSSRTKSTLRYEFTGCALYCISPMKHPDQEWRVIKNEKIMGFAALVILR